MHFFVVVKDGVIVDSAKAIGRLIDSGWTREEITRTSERNSYFIQCAQNLGIKVL